MKKNILIFIIFLGHFTIVNAQVTIAPTNVFIDSKTKFGNYLVINGSNQTQEISIDFQFAYTSSDSNGSRIIIDDDSVKSNKYSIANDIKAFPKNFTLAPNQRQVVRLRVSPSNELEDGTYWGRIKTTSSAEAPPLELQSNQSVTALVGVKIEQSTGIFYKVGTVTTGINILGIRANYTDDSKKLIVLSDIERTGNSPFLGSITIELLKSTGEIVKKSFSSTSLYFDTVYREEIDISDLPQGVYDLRVSFESKRSDLSINELVQMQPVSKTTSITIR